ncbi:hypothetical protein [Rhizobium sp. No.120]
MSEMTDTRRDNGNSKAQHDVTRNRVGSVPADQTKGEIDAASEHVKERAPDDVPNIEAEKEAVRQHGDAFVVKSDLEDADQREAAPGTREQP